MKHLQKAGVGILCVNMTELRDVQRAARTLFLGVSVSGILEGIGIKFSRWSKETCPHQCRGNETEAQRGWTSSLFLGWDVHFLRPSDSGSPGSLPF